MATTIERALGKAMRDMAAEAPKRKLEAQKKAAFVQSTPMIVLQERDFFRPGRIFYRRARLGELAFEPAHTQHFTRLGDPTPRTEDVPDRVNVDSRSFSLDQAPNYIRRINAEDSRKLRRLDARIAELEAQRRETISAAFARGVTLTPAQLKAAGERTVKVRKSGYRGFGPKKAVR